MRSGSITHSANTLGISQPAVSQSISQLESKLGCTLFDRASQKIVPTAKAFLLLERLAPLFNTLETLKPAEISQPEDETIKIISAPVFSRSFLPPLLLKFNAVHPNIRFQLEMASMNTIPVLLQERYAELALVNHYRNPVNSPIVDEPFARTRVCVFLPKSHPLSDRSVLTPADLSGEPLIIPNRRFLWSRNLRQAFKDARAELNVTVDFGSADLITDLLRADVGPAIAPFFPMNEVLSGEFAIVPFEPEIHRYSTFCYLSSIELSPTAKRFMDLARSEIKAIPHTELIDNFDGSMAENSIV